MRRHVLLAALAGIIVTPAAVAAGTATPTERIRLEPLAASPVRATAVVGRHGRGSRVTVEVSKAPRHALVRAVLQRGNLPQAERQLRQRGLRAQRRRGTRTLDRADSLPQQPAGL